MIFLPQIYLWGRKITIVAFVHVFGNVFIGVFYNTFKTYQPWTKMNWTPDTEVF